jgi:chaperone BCS1
MSLLVYLREQLASNSMLATAMVAAPVAALTMSARTLPASLWRSTKRAATIELTFNSDMADYQAVQRFVFRSVINDNFSRSYIYHADSKWDMDTGDQVAEHKGLSIGYGLHFGRYQGVIVVVNRQIVEGQQTEKFKERLILTFFTRRRDIIHQFADAIGENCKLDGGERSVDLFINSGDHWRKAGKLPLRRLATVVTEDNKAERLLKHLVDFEARRDWCHEKGLPYHTGVLLTGPPGTGKSSLIHAIASETGRSIHYLNLGSVTSDKQLTDLVTCGRNWARAIFVIEDADAANAMVTRSTPPPSASGVPAGEPQKPVTLSALLNVLDGLITPDGLVVMATSNHPEALDPALVRAGRFDLHMELGKLDFPAFLTMVELFDLDTRRAQRLQRVFEPTSGSALRSLLLAGGVEAVEAHFSSCLSKGSVVEGETSIPETPADASVPLAA